MRSSIPTVDISALIAAHGKAITRVVPHCMQANANTVAISAHETDVLVLLMAQFSRMTCERLWMKSGTLAKPKYSSVHTICDKLSHSVEDLTDITPFHGITGCDTVSHIAAPEKKTAWKAFCSDSGLLKNLGKDDPNQRNLQIS